MDLNEVNRDDLRDNDARSPSVAATPLANALRRSLGRRKFLKLTTAYFAGTMGIGAVVAACGGTSPSSSHSSSSKAGPGSKVINFFTDENDPASLKVYAAAIKDFEAKNPSVHIAMSLVSGDTRDQHAQTGLSVGQDLGIFTIDRSYTPAFVLSGYLAPLDNLVKSIGADQFTVGTRQVINGHDWIFPYAAGPFGCWYRTDLMQQPSTLQELKAAAKENTGGGRYGISLALGDSGAMYNTFPQFLWSAGGDYWDRKGNVVFGSDAARTAIQNVVDLLKYAPSGNTNWSPFQFITDYVGGVVAMAPWAGRLGVNMFEQGSPLAAKSSVIRGPWGPQRVNLTRWSTLAIDKKCQYPDEAMAFVQHVHTGSYGVAFANSVPGQEVPSVKSTRDAANADTTIPYIKAHPDWNSTIANLVLNGTDLGGPMGAVAGGKLELYNGPGAPWSQAAFGTNDIDTQMFQKIVLQGMSVKDAHAWGTEQYQTLVKNFKSTHPNWKKEL